MVSSKDTLFLDTSTQINRHWADYKVLQAIRSDLLGKTLCCSVYVERQYRYNVLNEFITVHAFVTNSKDIQEAQQRLEKCKGIPRQKLLYNIAKRLFNKYQSKKPLIKYLEKLIRVDWENYFYDALSKKSISQRLFTSRSN